MTRIQFFRTLVTAIAAMKAGQEVKVPEAAVSDVPGIGMCSFKITIAPKQFVFGDIFLYRAKPTDPGIEFFVDKMPDKSLKAVATKPIYDTRSQSYIKLEAVLEEEPIPIALDDYPQKHCIKLCNALVNERST